METFIHDADLPYEFNNTVRLGVDTETGGLKPHRDALRLVQINTDNKAIHIVRLHPNNSYPWNLARTLSDSNIPKVLHYARFDMGFLSRQYNINMTNVHCTKIMSTFVRTYAPKHGLADLYREMTGKEMSKVEATTNWGSANLTPEQLAYAAKDVEHLLDIHDWLHGMFNEYPERLAWAQEAFKFLPTRVEMDLAGFEDRDIFSH